MIKLKEVHTSDGSKSHASSYFGGRNEVNGLAKFYYLTWVVVTAMLALW